MAEQFKTSSMESDEDDDDTSDGGKSKKKSSAVSSLGGLTADRLLKAEAAKKAEPKQETLWERISRVADEAKAETVKPEEDSAVPLESLSPEEAQEAVRLYSESQLDTVGNEADNTPSDSPEAGVVAADMAFLHSLHEKLAKDPSLSVSEALDAAEAETIQELEPDSLDEVVEKSETELSDSFPELITPESVEDSGPTNEHEPPEPVSPGGGGGMPPDHPARLAGMAGGGNEYIPLQPASTSRAETPSEAMVTEAEAFSRERQAVAGGLLVGGIVGYLLGRRRGRIKTEKKLIPVQKKLEREVKYLHETVALREQSIRTQASEKLSKVAGQAKRQKIAERLLTKVDRVSQRAASVNEQRPTETAYADRSPERANHKPVGSREYVTPYPERFGRLLVEAPLAGMLLAGKGVERPSESQTLPIHNKVESFTPNELTKVAEKIKVEGTTLRELQTSNRLDEAGVRRVVAEYLRGGDIGKIVSIELREKELTFERDPRMKQFRTSARHGGGGALRAAGVAVDDSGSPQADTRSQVSDDDNLTRHPEPDEAALKVLRQQQALSVASVAIVLIAAILAMVFLFF